MQESLYRTVEGSLPRTGIDLVTCEAGSLAESPCVLCQATFQSIKLSLSFKLKNKQSCAYWLLEEFRDLLLVFVDY